MLTKLKRKFILINMVLVGVVLVTVFTVVCVNTYKNQMDHLDGSLSMAIKIAEESEGQPTVDKGKSSLNNGFSRSPESTGTLSVAYYREGDFIQTLNVNNLTITASVLKKAVAASMKSGKAKGKLADYDLYYMKIDTGDNTKIAFASSTSAQDTINATILTSILLCTGSLVVLFFISLLLASIALRPVQKTWDQQQQFIADASHELKTPLTVILANNNIILDHTDATVNEQKKWVESSQAEAKHMKNLIDNMLFLAKSDASKNRLIMSQTSLSDITMETFLQFEPVAFEKGIETVSDIDDGIMMCGDHTQLKQLIHILIDNACKYAGENGCVTVSLKNNVKNKRGRDIIVLSVNNTGKTIDKNDLPHLFERFYRADKARTEGEGYGLGLSIAKRIVEDHQGKISVESNAEKGTTFTVTFRKQA